MTTKERINAAWEGKPVDHIPMTTWCFGLAVPSEVRWQKDGKDVNYWFSGRMEHLHTLPLQWDVEDDFKRALAWKALGVDDLIDISVPWRVHEDVKWTDSLSAPTANERYPVMTREYTTPGGKISHSVRRTNEIIEPGWVVQPDHVPLIEDFNIPRAVDHAVSSIEDIGKIRYLFCPPGEAEKQQFAERMKKIKKFSDTHDIPVQAWSGFGMDAAVWFMGTENAIMLSIDDPDSFQQLMDIITLADLGRTELAASTPGVDIVVERGWYSSTDFWSPSLFDRFLFDHIKELASAAHRYGKNFGYVMTTGVEILGPRLADAGVDVLYFIDPMDPVQGGLDLERIRDLLGDRMTLVGGASALSLNGDYEKLEKEVRKSIEIFKPSNRFILHPVDAVFPDTPWVGIEKFIELWKKYR